MGGSEAAVLARRVSTWLHETGLRNRKTFHQGLGVHGEASTEEREQYKVPF